MRVIADVCSHLENSRWIACLLMILAISSGYGQSQDGNNSHGNNIDTDHFHHTVTGKEPYTIVYPQIIENKAGIIINDVKSYVRRRKRTLGKENKPLEISISGGNEIFELELWENEHFLAPGFKIYRRETLKRAQSDREIPQEDVYGCHFSGHIKEKSGSPATISICNGLNGLIRTDKDDYLIEPVKNATVHGASGFIGQPHKLYKRSILDSHNQHRYEAQTQGQKDIVMQKQEGRNAHEVSKAEDSQVFIKADAPQDSLRQSFHSVEKRAYDILGQSQHSVEKRAAYKFNYLRETTVPKTVEVLVVVDKNMYHKHGDANITTYTLTLFNMLSQLFRDGSLGNKINVVLVGLILLEGDERGLSIDFNADNTLNSFCQWQSVLVGANGRQHDHAILLTGLDLCSYQNSPCDTLGFAPMEGMCNRVRSCTINEDTGLSTAFTIAHEVGHNFGMFHDGEGNLCTESAGKIMSPTLMGKDGQFHWSVCSKAYLMRFLNTPQSDCLDDQPKQVAELKFPDKLPGELYNADIQCKWQFGSRARLCTYDFGKDICKALWCYRGNKRCETKFLPAAEGTSCGKGKWCRLGNCVDYGDEGPKPIDGGWSLWSEWSDCSRSCGGGVVSRDRDCSGPLPQYGGHTCDGEDRVFKMCNVQACPEDSEDFHTAQCSTYNKQPFQGWYLQWKPQKKLDDVNEPCKLHCIADTPNYVFTIKHTATDGMNCAAEDNHICVQGDCLPVGCDWIVDSNKKRDICGICNGDNSTCRHIQGEYLEQPQLNTYFPVTILPKAARSIRIREKSLSSNYLAVRNIYGKYFLNGHQRVAWPGSYVLGGAKFKYNRPYNEPESLEADGPLEEELVLEILVQDHNAGIHYEYTLPKTGSDVESSRPPDNYTWSLSVSSCTEPCAGGTKVVSIICHKNFEEEVAPSHCEGLEKPETGLFPCNEQPCEPRWVTEDWTACSKVCGGGKQKRRIRCRQKVSSTVDKKLKRKSCKHISKPITKQLCNERECPPDWHTSDWSKCSTTCNQGMQTRNVTCRSKNGGKIMPESMCHTEMPSQLKVCNLRPCPQVHMAAQTLQAELCTQEPCSNNSWVTGNWSTCSKECGGGVHKRKAWCESNDGTHIKNRMCKHLKKPVRREACNSEECQLEWLLGKWSECSQTCGNGQQQREVTCQTTGSRGNKVALENQCKNPKPEITRSCNIGPCDNVEQFDWLLSPWGPCSQTCGQGQSSRYLRCFRLADQQQTVVVSDNHCINISKPSIPMTETCRLMECVVNHNVAMATSSVWHITGWSECSKTCGNGIQSRIVSCVNNRGQPSKHCTESAQPESTQSCNMGECMPTPLGLVSCRDEYKWCYLVTLHKVCSDPVYQQKCCESCNQ